MPADLDAVTGATIDQLAKEFFDACKNEAGAHGGNIDTRVQDGHLIVDCRLEYTFHVTKTRRISVDAINHAKQPVPYLAVELVDNLMRPLQETGRDAAAAAYRAFSEHVRENING